MPGVLQSMGSQRVGHDWVTEQQKCHYMKKYIFFLFSLVLYFVCFLGGTQLISLQ